MIRPILKVIFYITVLVGMYACIIKYFSKNENQTFNPKVIEILKSVGEDKRTVIISKPDTIIVISKMSESDKGDYSSDPDVKFISGDKVIQKPRSQTEVKDGLVAYYPFNGNANDESGNKNHGIVHGATLSEDRFGKKNRAYYFDGNAWISVKDHPSLKPSGSITLSAWVKIDQSNVNDYLRIISKHGEVTDAGGSHGSYQLVTGRTMERGVGYFTIKTNIRYNTTFSKSAIPLGEWHMLTATWDGSNAILYYDDNVICVEKFPGTIQYDDNLLYIGKDGYYSHVGFVGKIDNVKIYNRALDYSEIKQLYGLK
jgi:hypothetical protein